MCFMDFEILVDFGRVDFFLQPRENIVSYENPDPFVNFAKYGMWRLILTILGISQLLTPSVDQNGYIDLKFSFSALFGSIPAFFAIFIISGFVAWSVELIEVEDSKIAIFGRIYR